MAGVGLAVAISASVAPAAATAAPLQSAGHAAVSAPTAATLQARGGGKSDRPSKPAKPPKGTPPELVGYDVSWPQCGAVLPSGQAFAIVGVNGGLATTTNPCLDEQLAWAATSTGGTEQPPVALYVNTANPADQAASWPTSNTYPRRATEPVDNPYGQCQPDDLGAACAFMYGYARAHDDATIRSVPNPDTYFWWLDVEIDNTWQSDKIANRAVLEGMTHYFRDVLGAAGVGIYSTAYQWGVIVGDLGPVDSPTADGPTPSILNGLPSWIPGATSLDAARAACARMPLTGGRITVTQYEIDNLDHDLACT